MLYKEIVEFLKSIKPGDKVMILHHWDMDGSSSAAIISRIIQHIRGKPADFIKVPSDRIRAIDSDLQRLIKDEKVSKLIIVDMTVEDLSGVNLNPDIGTGGTGKANIPVKQNILTIDHHFVRSAPKNTVYVNPMLKERKYIPASRICRDVACEFNIDVDWIAGFGIVQDFGTEDSLEIFLKLQERYPDYFPKKISQENILKCRYGNYSTVMNVKPYTDTQKYASLVYNVLMECNSPKDIESSMEYMELKNIYAIMVQEMRAIIDNYEKNRELHPSKKVIFYTFASDFNINSAISTKLSVKEPEWIFIVIKEHNAKLNISARCQSGRINLAELLRKSTKGIAPSEYGGHVKAAGASIPKKYFERFKENVLRFV